MTGAAGGQNYALLKSAGAEQIVLVSDDQQPGPHKTALLYHKVWLLHRVAQDHEEFLFLDFDCRPLQPPDEAMWSLLRSRGGLFGGAFQAACVGYRRAKVVDACHLRQGHRQRFMLNVCAVYCADRTWIADWLVAHEKLRVTVPPRMADNLMDEVSLMYLIDQRCGLLTSQELVSRFEIPIVMMRRATPEARCFPKVAYFAHR
jgi:hypothetical protein